jgi:hypothetical protein
MAFALAFLTISAEYSADFLSTASSNNDRNFGDRSSADASDGTGGPVALSRDVVTRARTPATPVDSNPPDEAAVLDAVRTLAPALEEEMVAPS